MAIGILIGGLGGLCTAGFIGVYIMSSTSNGGGAAAVSGTLLSLAIGAIPMGFGAGLFVLGRFLWRPAGPQTPSGAADR
jgi:hypothetical protein